MNQYVQCSKVLYNRSIMIGLIIPPPDIRKLLEKTAEHVAINGTDFQKILIEREQHKPQFAFLKVDSPYRPYYDHRVSEISKQMLQGLQPEESKQEQKVDPSNNQEVIKQEENVAIKVEQQPQPSQQALIDKIFVDIKEPEPDKYTAEIPEKLTEGEQAIIQHTAQYSARNGKNFLLALSQRQKNNPQFQFLRPSSKYHPYFQQLLQAYTYLLDIPDTELDLLRRSANNPQQILTRCRCVFEFHLSRQQQARGRKQVKQAKESNIDWNDFELVQTISFQIDHNKDIPVGQLISRIQHHVPQPKTMEEQIISQPKQKEILQQCHICRQNILASEINKHLKTCLGAKKKNNTDKGNQGQGQEVDIRKNLEEMSIKRPDIFGQKDNLIKNYQGGEEPQKQQKMQYDGQAVNINRSTGSLAMLLFQQKKLKEEQQKSGK